MMKISIIAFLLLLLGMGCSVHHAASGSSAAAPQVKTLTDSIIGDWKLVSVSYANPDSAGRKADFADGLIGKSVMMGNKKYTFTANNKTESGAWKITADRKLEVSSNTMNTTHAFQVVSVDGYRLILTYIDEKMPLLVTFSK